MRIKKVKPELRFEEFDNIWQSVLLEDVSVRGSGHTPNKNYPEYYNGGVKWISLADSKKLDNGYIDKTEIEISDEGIRNSSAVLHPKGSVLLSRDAGIGKSAVMKSEMAVSQHFIVWQPIQGKLSNWFLYYQLQIHKPEFERIAIGSTIKTIGLPYFKKLKITIPEFAEQQKIASFLSAVDEKIQQLTRKKALLEQYKKGVMQQLFSGKLRFKDENGKDYPKWEEKKLDDVAERVVRKNKENNLNVLTISAQLGLVSQLEYFNKSVAAKDVTNYYLLERNEFAYNKSYSAGYPMGAIKRLIRYDKGVVSTLYICFRFKEGVSLEFMEQYFETGKQNIEIEKVAQEGARNHGLLNIGVGDFLGIQLTLPSLAEQQKIANFLLAIDTKMESVANQITQTQIFKKGLLQQMFV